MKARGRGGHDQHWLAFRTCFHRMFGYVHRVCGKQHTTLYIGRNGNQMTPSVANFIWGTTSKNVKLTLQIREAVIVTRMRCLLHCFGSVCYATRVAYVFSILEWVHVLSEDNVTNDVLKIFCQRYCVVPCTNLRKKLYRVCILMLLFCVWSNWWMMCSRPSLPQDYGPRRTKVSRKVTEVDKKEYTTFHTKWFLNCLLQAKLLEAFDAFNPLWGNERLTDNFESGSGVKMD